jgi:hypothetical protein
MGTHDITISARNIIFGSLFYEAISVTRIYSVDNRVISE